MARNGKGEAEGPEGDPKPKRPRRAKPPAVARPKGKAAAKAGRIPSWLKTWPGLAAVALALVLVSYIVYAVVVSFSNGRMVEMQVHVGTDPDGTLYLRCGAASSPGVCGSGNGTASDQATFTVGSRDRVHVTVVNDDGGDHSITLGGGPYALWPAGFSLDLSDCPRAVAGETCADTRFTAWAKGSYGITCEMEGHADRGMRGTLVVQ